MTDFNFDIIINNLSDKYYFLSFDENENLIETPLKKIDGIYHLADNSKARILSVPFSKLNRIADEAWKNETNETLEVKFTWSYDRTLQTLTIKPNQIFYYKKPSVANLGELGIFEIC